MEKDKYFLQIARFEPATYLYLPLLVAEKFIESGLAEKGYKMVFVGYKTPTPYATKIKSLEGNKGIVVLDAIYDRSVLSCLRKNYFAYVHGNSIGSGTNPVLLEGYESL